MLILALLGVLLGVVPAAAQGLAVVSAASYIAPGSIAPDSWAAAYGVNIAREPVYGKIGDDGLFPTEVAGVTIKVNGELARIHFVSPGQANFLVPVGTAPGLASVVLDSGSAGRLSGEVRVLQASPGLFARNAQGFGPGSIQNGVTYKEAPFEVETPEIPGPDKRTRLAIYGTGFRFADSLQAVLTVPAGQKYEMDLEYFGPAGSDFGLDQANVVLPAELDADVDVSVELRTPDYRSNQVSFRMKPLPATRIQLQELLLDQDGILGGEPLQGTIRLNGRAPVGGTTVRIDYSPPASGPASVIVAQGEVEARFTIQTTAPIQIQTVEIRARAGSVDLRQPLTIYPRNATVLDRVFVNPEIVLGGKDAVGTVRLREATPQTISVALSSSDPSIASGPAAVTIFTGNVSAEFPIRTALVNARHEITIGASIEGSQASGLLSVLPAVQIQVRPQSVVGGATVDIEVELAEPAPVTTGALVELGSTGVHVGTPSNMTVPGGQRKATLRVNTLPVLSEEVVTIRALYRNVLAETVLTLQPSASITLESLTLNPTAVQGGSLVTGTVRLTAAAPTTGLFVDLSNDNGLAVFMMPFNVTVLRGQESVNFIIETRKVAFVENVTITATVGSVKKTANLTVNP